MNKFSLPSAKHGIAGCGNWRLESPRKECLGIRAQPPGLGKWSPKRCPGLERASPQDCPQLIKAVSFLVQEIECYLPLCALETNRIPRHHLSQEIHLNPGNYRYFCVPAGYLCISKEDDRFPVTRYLNGTRRNGIGNDTWSLGDLNRRPFGAKSLAIALRANTIG